MGAQRLLSLLVSALLALAGTVAPVSAAPQQDTWGAVTNLSRPAVATYAPVVTVTGDGQALAAWLRGDGRRARVLVASRHSDGTWSAPRRVPGTRGAVEVAVAFDGSGDLVVAWAAGRRVRAVRGTTAGSWEAPATLHRTRSGPRGTRPAYLDLAVNSRGRAVLAWETMDDDLDVTYARSRVQAVVGAPSGWWSRTRTLSARRTTAIRPQAVVSKVGRATVAWDQARGRRTRVMTASRDVGERWEPSRALTPWKQVYGAPRLAVNPSGEVAVAYLAGSRGIALRRWSRAEGWSQADQVPGIRSRVSWMDVGLDGAGAATIGWTNGARAVWTARQDPGGAWSRSRVAPRGSVFYGLQLLVNRSGDAVVGWDGQGGREHDVEAAYRPRDGSWGPPTALSDVRGDALGLTLALDERGNATAAWLFARRFGADSRVQARSLSAR